MDELLKILTADEKKIDILAVRLKELKKNIAHETTADTESRTNLGVQIKAMKKSNAVIVDHYLGEHKLATSEIDEIVSTHSGIAR